MINDNKDSKRRFDERYKSMKQQLWNVINQLEPELALARASVNYYKFQKTNVSRYFTRPLMESIPLSRLYLTDYKIIILKLL